MSQTGRPHFHFASLVERACTGCGVTKPLDDEHFYRSNHSKSGYQSRCKSCANNPKALRFKATHCTYCGSPEHNRGTCRLKPSLANLCAQCCGMPWRRRKPVCAGCHEPYAAERLPTAAEMAAVAAREDRRAEP